MSSFYAFFTFVIPFFQCSKLPSGIGLKLFKQIELMLGESRPVSS